jgi:hypothetical protein
MEKGKIPTLKNRLNKHEKIKNYSGFYLPSNILPAISKRIKPNTFFNIF